MESTYSTMMQTCFIQTNNTHHRTSGTIESWNLILKQVDHTKHRMRPDLFVKEHFPVLVGRQISFIDKLPKRNQSLILKV